MRRSNTRRLRREGRLQNTLAAFALQIAQRAEGMEEDDASDPGVRRMTMANASRLLVWTAGFFAAQVRRQFLEAVGQQLNRVKSRATLTLQEVVRLFFAVLSQNRGLWNAVSVPRTHASPINRLATISNSLALLCTGLAATGVLGDFEAPVRAVAHGATCVGAACAVANLGVRTVNHATGRHPLNVKTAIRLVGDAASGGAAVLGDSMASHAFAMPGYGESAEAAVGKIRGAEPPHG